MIAVLPSEHLSACKSISVLMQKLEEVSDTHKWLTCCFSQLLTHPVNV